MKRLSHIVDRITLADFRREAERMGIESPYRRARAKRFLERFDVEAPALLEAVSSGTWTPDPMVAHDILEHGKMRHIEIPSFRDSIVQRVLLFGRTEKHILNNTWPHAFSSVKGRGPLKAAKHVKRLIASGRAKWCLYFDVRKYYEHIDLDVAFRDLKDIIKDPVALTLFRRVLRMGERGLAIGNTASHIIANLYMTPVAQALRNLRGVSDVVTYMDNVFVFGGNKRLLHAAKREADRVLARRGLEMKRDWQIFRTDLRAVRVGGFCVRDGAPWRIYRATFLHALRASRDFVRSPSPERARSLAALRGWIVSAGCRSVYNRHFAIPWHNARKVIRNEARKNIRHVRTAR